MWPTQPWTIPYNHLHTAVACSTTSNGYIVLRVVPQIKTQVAMGFRVYAPQLHTLHSTQQDNMLQPSTNPG